MHQGPSTAHRNHPLDGQLDESPGGSNATRNATTAVHAEPRNDHYISVCAGRGAEAEGFEPPVPLGTLAFKSQGSCVSGYVPGCRPAEFRTIRLARCGTDSSRLLHGCYMPESKLSSLVPAFRPLLRHWVCRSLETSQAVPGQTSEGTWWRAG